METEGQSSATGARGAELSHWSRPQTRFPGLRAAVADLLRLTSKPRSKAGWTQPPVGSPAAARHSITGSSRPERPAQSRWEAYHASAPACGEGRSGSQRLQAGNVEGQLQTLVWRAMGRHLGKHLGFGGRSSLQGDDETLETASGLGLITGIQSFSTETQFSVKPEPIFTKDNHSETNLFAK